MLSATTSAFILALPGPGDAAVDGRLWMRLDHSVNQALLDHWFPLALAGLIVVVRVLRAWRNPHSRHGGARQFAAHQRPLSFGEIPVLIWALQVTALTERGFDTEAVFNLGVLLGDAIDLIAAVFVGVLLLSVNMIGLAVLARVSATTHARWIGIPAALAFLTVVLDRLTGCIAYGIVHFLSKDVPFVETAGHLVL